MTDTLFDRVQNSQADLIPFFLDYFIRSSGIGGRTHKKDSSHAEMILRQGWEEIKKSVSLASEELPDPAIIARCIRSSARALSDRYRFSPGEIDLAEKELLNLFYAEGPLTSLYQDSRITDIFIGGPYHVQCIVGGRSIETQARFRSVEEFEYFCSRRLPAQWDGALFETVLDDVWRTRLHAIRSRAGTVLSLRIPRLRNVQMADLVRSRTIPPGVALWLSEIVSCRQVPIFVVGGPRTGKTAMMQALIALLDRDELLCVVEDIPELGSILNGRDSIPLRRFVQMRPGSLSRLFPMGRLVIGEMDTLESRLVFWESIGLGMTGSLASFIALDRQAILGSLQSLARIKVGDKYAISHSIKQMFPCLILKMEIIQGLPRLKTIYDAHLLDSTAQLRPLVTIKRSENNTAEWVMAQGRSPLLDLLEERGCSLDPGKYLETLDREIEES